jgi:hypothetical protein
MTSSATPDSVRWRKASHSAESNCIEIAELADGALLLRSSKRPTDGPIKLTRDEIRAFILGVKAGEFDDLA